jgi:hypothetical protein
MLDHPHRTGSEERPQHAEDGSSPGDDTGVGADTATKPPPLPGDKSRRDLFKWAGVAALGAAGASTLADARRADAADGLPVVIGQSNSGSSTTSLSLSPPSSSPTLTIGGTLQVDQLRTAGPDPWADVKAYGAKGDGMTNDRPAFDLAKASLANGGVVFVPPGSYRLNGGFNLDVDGLVLQGAGRMATKLLIDASSGAGIAFMRQQTEVRDCTVTVYQTATPAFLVKVWANDVEAILRPKMENVDILGVNPASGIVGLYIKGGPFGHGVYGGRFDHVWIDRCGVALQSYTCYSATSDPGDTPSSDRSLQRNAGQLFTTLTITNCMIAFKANTALNHTFVNSDIEANDQAFDISYYQQWTFVGGYGLSGNAATGNVDPANSYANLTFIGCGVQDSGGALVDAGAQLIGRAGGGGEYQIPWLSGGRTAERFGTLSRYNVYGGLKDTVSFTSTDVSNDNSSLSFLLYQPALAEIADGMTNRYVITAQITAQQRAATGAKGASYFAKAAFKASRAGSTITVTQVGSLVLEAFEDDATWSVTASTINDANARFRFVVAGAAGDGPIDWTGRVWVTMQRGS